jgi:hypothetical protein
VEGQVAMTDETVPPDTAVFMRDEKGVVSVEWPSGRPREVMCSTEMIESWVDDRNAMVVEIARLESELEAERSISRTARHEYRILRAARQQHP